MPSVTVCVPWIPTGDRWRERAKHFTHRFWTSLGLDIVYGVDDSRPINRARARNKAAEGVDSDVLFFADADMWVPEEQFRASVEMAASTGQMILAYTGHLRLNRWSTEKVYAGEKVYQGQTVKDCSSGAFAITRELFDETGGHDERFCADEETDILTSRGWKSYRGLRIGDLVLTLNHVTGLSEWQPVEAVNVYPVEDARMMSMESKNHSSLTTLDHRWPTVRLPDSRGWGVQHMRRVWRTSATLTTRDLIPVAVQCAEIPTDPKYLDDLVELVAWFWTEGSIVKGRRGQPTRNVTISQSWVANPGCCDRIREVLTRLFGPAADHFVRRGLSKIPHEPAWTDAGHPSKPDLMAVRLNAEAGEMVQALAPGRVPSHEFLLSLTSAQLRLFIEVSELADGSKKDVALTQKNPDAAEAFQFACILAGFATSSRTRSLGPEKAKRYGYDMTSITRRSARCFGGRKGACTEVAYSGIVWCPTTENETWLARRHGTTYFTGNSGWGYEDRARQLAAYVIAGEGPRIPGLSYHLWHPRGSDQSRVTEERKRSRDLAIRYKMASGFKPRAGILPVTREAEANKEAMFAILREPGGPLDPLRSDPNRVRLATEPNV